MHKDDYGDRLDRPAWKVTAREGVYIIHADSYNVVDGELILFASCGHNESAWIASFPACEWFAIVLEDAERPQ